MTVQNSVTFTDPGLAVPQFESFADSPFKDEEGSYVIGATPFTARGRRLAGVEFDCLVVDGRKNRTPTVSARPTSKTLRT